jgi:glycosyltransferase involved in cell wall biosynthesis
VVASAAGGPREIVLDGVTGLLAPPGDAPALAAALRRLLADTAQRETMGLAARRRAEAEYSLAVMAERFMRVWAEVAGPAHTPPRA